MATLQILTKLKNSNRFGFLNAKHNSEKKVSMIEAFFSILTKPITHPHKTSFQDFSSMIHIKMVLNDKNKLHFDI